MFATGQCLLLFRFHTVYRNPERGTVASGNVCAFHTVQLTLDLVEVQNYYHPSEHSTKCMYRKYYDDDSCPAANDHIYLFNPRLLNSIETRLSLVNLNTWKLNAIEASMIIFKIYSW